MLSGAKKSLSSEEMKKYVDILNTKSKEERLTKIKNLNPNEKQNFTLFVQQVGKDKKSEEYKSKLSELETREAALRQHDKTLCTQFAHSFAEAELSKMSTSTPIVAPGVPRYN